MKTPSCIALLLMSCALTPVFAANENPEQPQDKNKTEACAKEAQGKSAGDRYDFMRECVQEKSIEAKPSASEEAQQASMKACETEAKGEDEAARKQFIRKCMREK